METRIVAGKYRIIEVIGRGGMATVYRAENVTTQQVVALKLLQLALPTESEEGEASGPHSGEMVVRFEREARSASAIDNEHIARVLDAGIDGETNARYIAMDLLEGQDLNTLLREKRILPADVTLKIVGQALNGVAAAHRAGIVHRDLKPANLFLTTNFYGGVTVKVLDFGIAKDSQQPLATMAGGALTQTGSMLGTPQFMSPEQIGAPKSVDARTDVWSLGVVLYKCLSGRTPHDQKETLGALLVALMTEQVPPIRGIAPWVTPEVAAVVDRALAHDAAKRFATASEMLDAVKALCPKGFALRDGEYLSLPVDDRADRAAAPPAPDVAKAEEIQVATPSVSVTKEREAAARAAATQVGRRRPVGPGALKRFFSKKNQPVRAAWLRALTAVLTVAVVAWVARLGIDADKLPPPLDEAAPSAAFSAGRAAKELDAIAGSDTPRPLGSPEAMRVHDYIEARLKSFGYSPSEQNTLVCRPGMGCTNVRNVVARNREPDGSGMVLLVAHYDSVPAGPGAGDDGSGVAVALEAARAIAQNPDPSERAIGFLFDEGEEEGLFGAAAFVEQHAWMRDVKSVVNVDARGTHGNSLLFEMFGDTDAIAKRASEVLPRPWASSLLAAVYSHMPNDTDLTMFRRYGGGLNGANLAFLEGVARYHTSGDTVDALDRSTLQAQGENALALTRGFASPAFAAGPPSEGTFFDLFHRHLVCANLMVTWALAGLAFIVSAVAIGRLPVRFAWFGKSVAAFLWLVFGLVFAGAGVTLYGWAAEHMGALPAPSVAEPKYLIAAFLSVALAAIVATTYLATRNDRGYAPEPERTSAVAWFLFAVIGVATAVFVPGVAYLFALPALVAGLVRIALPKAGHLAEAAGGAVLAALATPIVLLLYEALGFGIPAAFALPIALFVLPLAPLVAEASRVVLALAAAVLVIASALALRAPAFTVANPQRVDVVYTRDVSRSTSEVAIDAFWGDQAQGDVPRAMKSALGDDATPGAILPWSGHLALRKEMGVATKDQLPPSIDNKTEERDATSRIVRFHLIPPPGARAIALAVRDSSPLTSAQIAGREWPQAYVGSGDSRWRLLILRAPPAKGTDVTLSIAGSLPVEARLQATMSGLPPVAAAVVQARPPTAMASQEGDRSVIVTQLSL